MIDPGFDVELAPDEVAALLGREDQRPAAVPRLAESTPILVTGAGGSLGSLLVRRLCASGHEVLALDRSESALFRLALRLDEMEARPPRLLVRDAACASLLQVMKEEGVRLVVHAAAHKHVGLMEQEEAEAFKNNVEVTRTLLDLAEAAGVADFLLLSTDKAVDPISVMGRSKARAEDLVLEPASSVVRARVLRLPNVLGTAGSVAQIFRRALLRKRPLVLRDPQSTRLYLGPEEALAALLGALAWRGRGLLAPADPPALPLLELARRAHEVWGAGEPFSWREVAPGPGERAEERLLSDGERRTVVDGLGPLSLVERGS